MQIRKKQKIEEKIRFSVTRLIAQLGHGDINSNNKITNKYQPTLIEFFKDKQISHVYCSYNSSFILSSKYIILLILLF